MGIVDANQAAESGITASAALSSEPASSQPDLSGYSKEQLSDMLNSGQSLDGSAAKAAVPPELKQEEQPKTEPPKDELKPESKVPDKFKNPDGTVNVDSLLKSYSEAEKVVSRQLNVESQIKQLAEQNIALQQALEEMKQSKEEPAAKELTPDEIAQMTPEELKGHLDKQIESKFQALKAEQDLNEKIQQSINQVSQMDGARELEADIAKILQSQAVSRHPEAPMIAYYAALGSKAPMLVTQARNMGYSEGYAKAKAELLQGVDSGKASTTVESGALTEDQIMALSKEEHAKLLNRYE